MKVTLAQITPKLNRSNLDLIVSIVESHIDKSDIIVFPELALNGYMLQDKLYEDAWRLSELSILADLSQEIDICVGAALREGDIFKNSALYFSKGKILSKHDKVHLPNYGMFEEARYFEVGKTCKSFMTEFGKISMLVCEDLWHSSMRQNLVEENPDFIIVLVASPARGFSDSGLEIEDDWHSIIQSIAQDCKAKVIFVNRTGFEDGLGFWGGSCFVGENGNILEKLEHYREEIKTIEV